MPVGLGMESSGIIEQAREILKASGEPIERVKVSMESAEPKWHAKW